MTHRTRIKICGLTREADIEAAVEAGADAVGFVFYDKSSRHVTLDRAAQLARLLPPFVMPVGLFVNAGTEAVVRAADALGPMLVQFHGDEAPQDCLDARRPFLRAARMEPGFDLLNFCHQFNAAQAVLLDAPVEGYGGGGKVFDWSLIPRDVPLPVVLSGGLSAANVADAVVRVRPWAVDVSSGVEVGKGIKDARLIQRFCAAVREADASLVRAIDTV